MSLVLVGTTVFPHVDVTIVSLVLGGALLVVLGTGGVLYLVRRPMTAAPPGGAGAGGAAPRGHRDGWRMPPLALLGRPPWSRGRLLGMWALRAYLVVAVLLLVVKAVQLGAGH
jgi:hypothetical protein